MRVARAALAAPVLLLLLTWLLLQGMNLDAPRYDQAFAALDRFAMLESALRRDVLVARAGMLRNYDRLVRETDGLDAAIARLRMVAVLDESAGAALDRLEAVVREEQALVERFKSCNALLQNSLAYFAMFTERLGAPNADQPPPPLGRLAAAMLRFTRDPSPAAATELEIQLDWLELSEAAGGTDRFEAMIAHGRLIHRLMPRTAGILTSLLNLPSNREVNALRAAVVSHQMASREASARYRLLLYATSLVLVALLVQLGLRLRGRALALQRRAAFERVTAGVSARFINARSHELDAHVEQALGELATSIGADRAYFVTAGTTPVVRAWRRAGAEFPPGWPARAVTLAASLVPAATGLVHVPRLGRLPPGDGRTALFEAGVRGWAAIVGPGGASVLGFDAVRRGPITRANDLGFLRPAFDVVANAVERQSLEAERGRLEANLQQARRLETVGTLASGIAHNFNNIVGAILGYTEMAEAEVPTQTRTAQYLGEIRRAGERARDVVDQILTFGKGRSVRRKPVSVAALMAEVTSLLQASLPSRVVLIAQPVPDAAQVLGDAAQLVQVIVNLCNNAAQAMDGAGEIEVSCELETVAEPRLLSHGDLRVGRYVRISVADDGRGMDEATSTRIFEPFFTTRAVGSGLGLATVREIVRAHRGVMNVVSAPGAGTRMEAWLPSLIAHTRLLAAPAADRGRDRAETEGRERADDRSGEPVTVPLGRGETVLIVDAEHRRVLQDEEMLAALGYEPVGFARPEQALSARRSAQGRFDAIVVCDGVAASGVALAAALNRVGPRLPIVLATIPGRDLDADGLAAAGIADVVRYPLIAAEIAAALQRCLQDDRARVA